MTNLLILPSDNVIDLDSIAFIDNDGIVIFKNVNIAGGGQTRWTQLAERSISSDDIQAIKDTIVESKESSRST